MKFSMYFRIAFSMKDTFLFLLKMVKRRNLRHVSSANKNLREPRSFPLGHYFELRLCLTSDRQSLLNLSFVAMSMMIYSVFHRVLVSMLNLCVSKKVPVGHNR